MQVSNIQILDGHTISCVKYVKT